MAGRKSHQPTKLLQDTVSLHAMVGTPQALIAELVGVSEKILRKYYRSELDHAIAKANATIGGALFNKARGGDTTAQIFWMKTRAGWRETKPEDELDGEAPSLNISFSVNEAVHDIKVTNAKP